MSLSEKIRILNLLLSVPVFAGMLLSISTLFATVRRRKEFWKSQDPPNLVRMTYGRAIRLNVCFIVVQVVMFQSTLQALVRPEAYSDFYTYEVTYVRRVLVSLTVGYCSVYDLITRRKIVEEVMKTQR